MNEHIKQYLDIYGIKDTPELAETEAFVNDNAYFYYIDDNLQGWYIKKRIPNNTEEALIIDILTVEQL